MPDRVKAALFSILGSRLDCPGSLPSVIVADVFAGSGSLGLEALSRGAQRGYFFERDARALKTLQDNLNLLDAGSRAIVRPGNAWTLPLAATNNSPFQLIFLDPPYSDSEDTRSDGPVRTFARRLACVAAPNAIIVIHHRSTIRYPWESADLWRPVDHRVFGTNALTMLEK